MRKHWHDDGCGRREGDIRGGIVMGVREERKRWRCVRDARDGDDELRKVDSSRSGRASEGEALLRLRDQLLPPHFLSSLRHKVTPLEKRDAKPSGQDAGASGKVSGHIQQVREGVSIP